LRRRSLSVGTVQSPPEPLAKQKKMAPAKALNFGANHAGHATFAFSVQSNGWSAVYIADGDVLFFATLALASPEVVTGKWTLI